VSADRDLTNLADRHVMALAVDHPHLNALDRGTDGARLAFPVRVVEGRERRGLRQAVPLEDHAAERLLERAQHLDRQGCPAGDAHAQAGDVKIATVRHGQHRRVHGRHALEDRHPVAIDNLQRPRGVEPRNERQGRSDRDGGVEPTGLAEGVEQRQAPHHDVLGPQVQQGAGCHRRVGAQVGVRELGAFRLPGRAGGVEDDRGVLPRAAHRLRVRREVGEHLLQRAGRDHDGLGACRLRPPGGLVGHLVPGE